MGVEQKSASMGSGECDSGETEAKRTSVREPKVEPEVCRQNPAQRRAGTPFGRTGFLTCSSKII